MVLHYQGRVVTIETIWLSKSEICIIRPFKEMWGSTFEGTKFGRVYRVVIDY